MAIQIPPKFRRFLIKKCKTCEIELLKSFRENETFVENLLENPNDEIIDFLVGDYFENKPNKEMLLNNFKRSTSFNNYLLIDTPTSIQHMKSNSEIIITPIKKKTKTAPDDDDNLYDFLCNNEKMVLDNSPPLDKSNTSTSGGEDSPIENIDNKDLYFDFQNTASMEVTKIIDHIDDLVEENHRKNSFDSVICCSDNIEVVPDSNDAPSDDVIPETPIKNMIGNSLLENIRFSPCVLDAFSKSPIEQAKSNKHLSIENDLLLITPEQRSNEASFKLTKPIKDFETITSSPKQISSFNSKLRKNSAKPIVFPNIAESPISNDDVVIEDNSINETKSSVKSIEPIKFNKRLSILLKKDVEVVQLNSSNRISTRNSSRVKRGSSDIVNGEEEESIKENEKEEDSIQKNEQVCKKAKTVGNGQPRRISNIPEVIKSFSERLNKSFTSDFESYDDSDKDMTYGEDVKSRFTSNNKKTKVFVDHVTPEKSKL